MFVLIRKDSFRAETMAEIEARMRGANPANALKPDEYEIVKGDPQPLEWSLTVGKASKPATKREPTDKAAIDAKVLDLLTRITPPVVFKTGDVAERTGLTSAEVSESKGRLLAAGKLDGNVSTKGKLKAREPVADTAAQS